MSQTSAKPSINVDELQQKLTTIPLTEEGDEEEEEQDEEQDGEEDEDATVSQTAGLFTSGGLSQISPLPLSFLPLLSLSSDFLDSSYNWHKLVILSLRWSKC